MNASSVSSSFSAAEATPRDVDNARLRHSYLVLALTSLALFAAFLDTTILYVAFPSIRRSFPAISDSGLSWVLNAYNLVFAATLLPAGRIADQFGRKRVFLLGMLLFVTASAVCGLSKGITFLIAFRAVQAIGAAALLPSSLALVLAEFSKERRVVAVTAWGAVGGLAAATGPTLGALLIQQAGWPWAFFINLPVGAVAIFFGWRLLSESRDEAATPQIDVLGIVLSIGSTSLLTYAFANSQSLRPAVLATLLTLFALLLACFILRCAVSSAPVVDLSLFRTRNFRWANAATTIFSVAFNAMYISNVLFLTQVWRYSTVRAGLALTPAPLLVFPLSIVSGRIASKRGHRPVIVMGGIFFALAGLWQWHGLTARPDYVHQWLFATVLTGLGVGMTIPVLGSAAAYDLPPNRFGIGGAVNGSLRQLGGAFGVALAIGLVASFSPGDPVAPFRHVFLLMCVCGVATSFCALFIATRPVSRVPKSQ